MNIQYSDLYANIGNLLNEEPLLPLHNSVCIASFWECSYSLPGGLGFIIL